MCENSCIETPAAPEWLSKLENRRELLKRGKLGHEAGAGAPCNECGNKCPGLDLHFWRKVCRNCKCRKDQHMCSDDDSSGWAQFEILGQIRSKPAFIKIKALASQPIQLEWVPPNAAPDVITDYMEKLDPKQIPVAGSEAAQKRKQQLEFQVPPHDLDAALCDNLTEVEANQLEMYVQRVRDNCVGQGNVVRVGNVNHAHVLQLANSALEDPILGELLANEQLQEALMPNYTNVQPKLLVAFSTPICETLQAKNGAAFTNLSQASQQNLRGLNAEAVQSSLQHAAIYDKVFAVLEERHLDVSQDPRLGPLLDFQKAYKANAQLRKEINSNFANSTLPAVLGTPARQTKASELVFNSPLPVKHLAQTRMSAQMRQDTPVRKLRLGNNNNNNNVQSVLQACGLPPQLDCSADGFLSDVLKAEPLKQALQSNSQLKEPLILSTTPLPPFKSMQGLNALAKQALAGLNINEKALKSVILNAPYYDAIYQTLAQKNIDFSQCKILQPLQELRQELQKSPLLRAELHGWVHNEPDSQALILEPVNKSLISNSNSSDSGFDSKPSTPRSTPGKFVSIPGIEDMPMYPTVKPSLPQMLEQLQLVAPRATTPELNCVDCIKPICLGEIAVKAERADKGMAWHPGCFKCHTCRELLADLVYFFYNGHVYCGRDLALKLKIPRCKACDELIFTKEYTAAEDAAFHIKHFCCYHCDTPLAGHQYVPDEKTNMPLCLKCYEQYFAAACQTCKQFIGPADQGVALGDIHWHGTCFNCAGEDCGKSLIGGRFCVKQSMPFCSPNCMRSIIK